MRTGELGNSGEEEHAFRWYWERIFFYSIMKAPIGRIGGKSKLASYLVDLIPPNIKTYVELFTGGGSLFFKRDKDPLVKEVINDIDPRIYKILKGLQTRSSYINNHIRRELGYNDFQKIKNKTDVISIIEVAKSSFYGQHYKGFMKDKNTKIQIKTDFSKYGERLKNVVILNEDFRKVINKYNDKDTFFYLDPPYEDAGINKDYKDYIDPKDVLEAVKTIKGYFMISYNDSKNIRNLFKDYKIVKVSTIYNQTNILEKRKANELIIMNYSL
jgi:DNA adenine methylase